MESTSSDSTTFHSCLSTESESFWLDGDDSDHSGSIAVEDDESKDENDAGNTPSASNLEKWRPVSPEGSFKRNITSWRKGQLLGKGSYGDVYEVMTDDGSFFAVKEVSLLDQQGQVNQGLLQLEQEIVLYRQFKHENIVRYIGTDKDNEKLYVFLELMPKGSLSSLYHKYDLTESQVSSYTGQILNGLKYLHDQMVMHRDIKCANILVGSNGSVKLADFGLAKAIDMSAADSFKGSLLWMAPERFKNRSGSHGLKSDIWSLGCTVAEMFTCKNPYSDLDLEEALSKIRKGEPPRLPKSLSEDARNFICDCLQRDPKKRPSAAQLLNHPFVMKPSTSGSAMPSPPSSLL